MKYVEISCNARHGRDVGLFFIPVSEMSNYTGFRTTAQFSEDDVLAASEAGTISALDDTPLYLDTLFVDFDNSPANADTFRDWLIEHDYCFELYHSGSRSQHFHVNICPLESKSASKSLKQFMIDTFGEGFCDQSLYSYTSLFRLPGTIHEKTGNPKTLLERQGFNAVKIDLVDKQVFDELVLDLSGLEYSLIRYVNLLETPATNGNRSQTLWQLAKSFAEAGLTYSCAEELLLKLNESWGRNAKEESKVKSQCRWGFK